jgi:hypothetical protein
VTDLDALIREVHEMWGEPYGEVSALMFRLADALETLRAERDELKRALQDELDNWNPEARPTLIAERDEARGRERAADEDRRAASELMVQAFAERDAALAREAALRLALEQISEQQQQTMAKLRKHGIVFDAIGADPSNWQHVAFSIYTDLCEVDSIARAALASSPPAAEPDDEKLLYASDVAAEMFGPPAAEPEASVGADPDWRDQHSKRPCGRYVHDNTDDGVRYCRCGWAEAAHMVMGSPAAKPEPGEAGVLLSASAPVGSEAQPQGSEPADTREEPAP